MSNKFDFVSSTDKPALLAFSTPEWLEAAMAALNELGFKVHTAVILFGNSFQTFTPMQAFQQSVHAVINPSEQFLLKQLIEKAVSDNSLFLHSYHEAQTKSYASAEKEA